MNRIVFIVAALLTVALPARATEITVTAPQSDYLSQVNRVLVPALLAELVKHRVSATVKFSFIIDERAHKTAVEVHSSPRDAVADDMIARTIRRVKLPPVPPGRPNGNNVVQIRNTLSPARE